MSPGLGGGCNGQNLLQPLNRAVAGPRQQNRAVLSNTNARHHRTAVPKFPLPRLGSSLPSARRSRPLPTTACSDFPYHDPSHQPRTHLTDRYANRHRQTGPSSEGLGPGTPPAAAFPSSPSSYCTVLRERVPVTETALVIPTEGRHTLAPTIVHFCQTPREEKEEKEKTHKSSRAAERSFPFLLALAPAACAASHRFASHPFHHLINNSSSPIFTPRRQKSTVRRTSQPHPPSHKLLLPQPIASLRVPGCLPCPACLPVCLSACQRVLDVWRWTLDPGPSTLSVLPMYSGAGCARGGGLTQNHSLGHLVVWPSIQGLPTPVML